MEIDLRHRELYQKFIHFNPFLNKWMVFDRSETFLYLTKTSEMKTLETFNNIEEIERFYSKK